jgi:hypothetical protein
MPAVESPIASTTNYHFNIICGRNMRAALHPPLLRWAFLRNAIVTSAWQHLAGPVNALGPKGPMRNSLPYKEEVMNEFAPS